ncbi:hypothetical protein TNCV_285541 [Trichonephila clavipes]|nr:hypothetical protein TNCV_285541 [Trichonephila clavipes]
MDKPALLRWPSGHGPGLVTGVSLVQALVPLKIQRVEELMLVKSTVFQSSHVDMVWKLVENTRAVGEKHHNFEPQSGYEDDKEALGRNRKSKW